MKTAYVLQSQFMKENWKNGVFKRRGNDPSGWSRGSSTGDRVLTTQRSLVAGPHAVMTPVGARRRSRRTAQDRYRGEAGRSGPGCPR